MWMMPLHLHVSQKSDYDENSVDQDQLMKSDSVCLKSKLINEHPAHSHTVQFYSVISIKSLTLVMLADTFVVC